MRNKTKYFGNNKGVDWNQIKTWESIYFYANKLSNTMFTWNKIPILHHIGSDNQFFIFIYLLTNLLYGWGESLIFVIWQKVHVHISCPYTLNKEPFKKYFNITCTMGSRLRMDRAVAYVRDFLLLINNISF